MRPTQFLEKFLKILELSTLQKWIRFSPYSLLQFIGRVATPKLVPRNCLRYLQTALLQYISRAPTPELVARNCLRYLQTTLIMGEGELVSEFMWGIVVLQIGSPMSNLYPLKTTGSLFSGGVEWEHWYELT